MEFKFLKTMPILVSVGILYPKIIILGHKMRSTSQKSIIWNFFWKSLKRFRIAISQPLLVLSQNPLGGKVYLGHGSKPCKKCMDTSQVKFLHLVTFEKNDHLTHCAVYPLSCSISDSRNPSAPHSPCFSLVTYPEHLYMNGQKEEEALVICILFILQIYFV